MAEDTNLKFSTRIICKGYEIKEIKNRSKGSVD